MNQFWVFILWFNWFLPALSFLEVKTISDEWKTVVIQCWSLWNICEVFSIWGRLLLKSCSGMAAGLFFFFFCLKLLGSYFPHHKLSWSSYFIFSKSQNGTESVFSFVLLPRWWRAIFKKNNFFYKKKKSKKTVNVFHFFLFVFKGKELGTKMFRVLVSYLYSRKIH